jgi:hypothetical protein
MFPEIAVRIGRGDLVPTLTFSAIQLPAFLPDLRSAGPVLSSTPHFTVDNLVLLWYKHSSRAQSLSAGLALLNILYVRAW